MTPAHVHLMLTHVPIVAIPIGAAILGAALYWKSRDLQNASFGVFVLAALATGVVFLTGEPAEEIVEHLPGVSEALIEQHEDVALYGMTAAVALGLLGLVGLGQSRRELAPRLARASLALAAVTITLISYTALLGGQIRHTEVRAQARAALAAGEH